MINITFQFFALLALVLGVAFYQSGRLVGLDEDLFDFITASLPSFLHAFALLLFALTLIRHSSRVFLILIFTVLLALIEISQIWWFGTFDWLDLWAIALAVVVVSFLIPFMPALDSVDNRLMQLKLSNKTRSLVLVLVAYGFSAASSTYEPRYDKPLMMSYEELRSAVAVEERAAPADIGKVFVYQNFLLINEPYKGIHIYDNTSVDKPEHIAFVKIPGNKDILIKDDVIYADSFMDFVVLSLSDKASEIKEIQRYKSIFDYNPYQILDGYDFEFEYDALERTDGVLVGYQVRDSSRVINRVATK